MIGKMPTISCVLSLKKSSFHIEAVSKLLENRDKKDIISLFVQENLKQKQARFRSLQKILTAEESNFSHFLKFLILSKFV